MSIKTTSSLFALFLLLANVVGIGFNSSLVYASLADTPQMSANNSDPLSTDVNGDGVVNVFDLYMVCRAWGSYPGHPGWNSTCDLNDDNSVNLLDIILVMKDLQPSEPTHQSLFQDDFGGTLDNWEVVNGDWYVENGRLRGDCWGRGVILFNGDVGQNYEISVKVYVISSPITEYEVPSSWTTTQRPEAQIAFRHTNGNYYFAGLGAYAYKSGIGKFVDGEAQMIASGGNANYQDVNVGVWYNLKLVVNGDYFEVYVDDVLVCSVSDSTHKVGRVGLTTIWSSAYFDDFVIKKIDSVPLNPSLSYMGFQLNTRRYWKGTVWEPDQSDYDQIASWGTNTLKSICWWSRDIEKSKSNVGVYSEEYMYRIDKHIRMMEKAGINYIAGVRVCIDDNNPNGWATAGYVCTPEGLERYCDFLEWFVQWLESKDYPNLIGYEPWLMPFHSTSPTSSQRTFYYDQVMPAMANAVKKHSDKLLFMTPIHQSRLELKNIRTSFIENNRGRAYYGFGFYWYQGMQHTGDVTVWDYDYDAQKEYLQPALDFRNEHNVPLYIIEFGVRGERQDQVDVLDYKLTLLEENNISWIGYWQYDKYDGSTSWALLNYPADTPRWKLVNVFRNHCLGK